VLDVFGSAIVTKEKRFWGLVSQIVGEVAVAGRGDGDLAGGRDSASFRLAAGGASPPFAAGGIVRGHKGHSFRFRVRAT
jgi:hypothetical protein